MTRKWLAGACYLLFAFGSRQLRPHPSGVRTYSSLSLRLLFRRPVAVVDIASFLLSSIALRSCSASSYAESRLFMVARRFPAKDCPFERGVFSFNFL